MSCTFCSEPYRKISPDGYSGNGIDTIASNLAMIFGGEDENGIRLNGNTLIFDNSSGEYKQGEVDIAYCPICGRRLKEES